MASHVAASGNVRTRAVHETPLKAIPSLVV